jgi:hypothetical protein
MTTGKRLALIAGASALAAGVAVILARLLDLPPTYRHAVTLAAVIAVALAIARAGRRGRR